MTTEAVPTVLVAAAALGCGLVGGVFFAFSGFVLAALGRLPVAAGSAAMRAVNEQAVRPPLMVALFGTGLLSVAAVVAVLVDGGDGLPTGRVLLGAGLYLVGVLGVTVLGNVPLNDALARRDPAVAEEPGWSRWRARWGRLNHVRTVSALLAAAAQLAAMVV